MRVAPGFRSKAQEEWMWRRVPRVAERWTEVYGTFDKPILRDPKHMSPAITWSWREVEKFNAGE